jgi:hypothetical protein
MVRPSLKESKWQDVDKEKKWRLSSSRKIISIGRQSNTLHSGDLMGMESK